MRRRVCGELLYFASGFGVCTVLIPIFLLRQRQAHHEGAAVALLAFHRDGASVEFHQLTSTGEPDTCSREASDHVCAPVESVEDVWQVVLRNSETFVAHDEHGGLAIRSIRLLYRDADRPAFGTVLDRVGEKVAEHAMRAGLVHRYNDSRCLGLEQKLVEVGDKL